MSDTCCHGLLVVEKPLGITSRDAVDRAVRWFPKGTKLGHTGTLDPLASGVLVLCVGAATRLTEYVQAMAKVYRTTIALGARSATDDAEGPITGVDGAQPLSHSQVAAALESFQGEIEQTPPAFSAAKSRGRRAYALARRGDHVDLAPRRVRVSGIALLNYEYPVLELEIHCGKGTYIRSIARDLGERLGCGGYVAALRRTKVGEFTADDALALTAEPEEAYARLLPLRRAVEALPLIRVSAGDAARLRNGVSIATAGALSESEYAVIDEADSLVAIGRPAESGQALRPVRVFPAC